MWQRGKLSKQFLFEYTQTCLTEYLGFIIRITLYIVISRKYMCHEVRKMYLVMYLIMTVRPVNTNISQLHCPDESLGH